MEALVEARLRPPPPPPLPPSSAAVATRMLTFGMDRLLSSSKSSKEDREDEELEEEEEEGEDDAEGRAGASANSILRYFFDKLKYKTIRTGAGGA